MQPKLLAKQAATLRRQIYASLPWGVRLAVFLQKLANGTLDAFGRVVYAEFIKRGVEGLPDIGNEPALSWREKLLASGTRAGDKVPRGYGKDFARKAWNIMLGQTKNPEMVEELMTLVMERLIKNPTSIKEASPLKISEGYVLTMLKNLRVDKVRYDKHRRDISGPSLTVEDESGEDITLDVKDPDSWKQVAEMLPESELREILKDLERIHPSAAAFVDLSFQGYTLTEMARGGLLPHLEGEETSTQAVAQWVNRWLPRIQKVVQDHILDVGDTRRLASG